MGKRGAKPKGKVKIHWSANFAYAVGLLASDGCLSPSGRHIILVSVDKEQLQNFMKALDILVFIGEHKSGSNNRAFRIQFGDILFYQFLISIGLTPNKSKTIGEIKIPPKYFFDFLRGSFDGDGCTYSYWDKRWKSSYMFYTEFVSFSRSHILWLQKEIENRLKIKGHITGDGKEVIMQLKYAKADSLRLLKKMYYKKGLLCLERKRLKIKKMLSIVGEKL